MKECKCLKCNAEISEYIKSNYINSTIPFKRKGDRYWQIVVCQKCGVIMEVDVVPTDNSVDLIPVKIIDENK